MNLYAHVSPGTQKQAANLFDEMGIGASKDESVTIACWSENVTLQ
jgi:hypothetical protein